MTQFQSDARPVSEGFQSFFELRGDFADEDKFPLLSLEERNYIIDCIRERWEFIQANCHAVANLLDIRYLGMHMDDDTRLETVDLICDFPPHIGVVNSDEDKMNIRTEFDKYQL